MLQIITKLAKTLFTVNCTKPTENLFHSADARLHSIEISFGVGRCGTDRGLSLGPP